MERWPIGHHPQKKSDPKDCNNWGGLYVGDHASKILSSVLAQQLIPSYVSAPVGLVPHLRWELHLLLTRSVPFWMLHGCVVISQQCYSWICGKPLTSHSRVDLGHAGGLLEDRHLEYVRDIGLTLRKTFSLSATLRDEGCVSLVVTRLLTSLRTGAWCTLDGDEHILSTRRGGRQGCLHGPSICNMERAMALSQIRQRLMSLNMSSGVRPHDNLPFWVSRSGKFLPSVGKSKIPCGSLTSEVTYVDDQAFLMTATTPRGLKRVITNTLETVTSVFWAHGLNINFKQGETELVVNLQGSSRSKRKYRAEIQEQHNTFLLPAYAPVRVVHVVPRYKHLGSVVDNDHRCNADTLARVHPAMSSYSPIAITEFGDPKFSVHVRLLLSRSLVFSRLFQGKRRSGLQCLSGPSRS